MLLDPLARQAPEHSAHLSLLQRIGAASLQAAPAAAWQPRPERRQQSAIAMTGPHRLREGAACGNGVVPLEGQTSA